MKESTSFLVFIISLCGSSFLVDSQVSDSCSSNLNLQVPIPFETANLHCLDVWNAQGFILRYFQTDSKKWSFLLSAPDPNSYIAIGFSPNGNMVGSSAIVGWISSNGGEGGMKQYYLGGTSPNQVVPEKGNLKIISNSSFITTQSSRLFMAFQLDTNLPHSKLIYAVGPNGLFPSTPIDALIEHKDKISTTINYATGSSASQSPYVTLRRSHGILNIMGWGILIVIGIIAARHLKHLDPLWFYLHVFIQSIGFTFGVIGIICGLVLGNELNANVSIHKALGIFILVLGSLQVMAILARPDKGSKVRMYWNWYHYNVGRILIILSIANIFYGIRLGNEGNGWNAGYGSLLATLIIIAFVLEIRMRFRK